MGQSFNWKDKGAQGCLCHAGEPKGIGAKRQTQSLSKRPNAIKTACVICCDWVSKIKRTVNESIGLGSLP
jgi:hypothetical protein